MTTPKITSAKELNDLWGCNGVLYGASGSGKTTFVASAAQSEWGRNVLIVDIDGGARSVHGLDYVDVTRPTNLKELNATIDWFTKGQHEYRTIGIDTLTEVQDMVMANIMSGRDDVTPEQRDWFKCGDEIQRMMRKLRTLSQIKGWNCFFTARERTLEEKISSRTRVAPAIIPSVIDRVIGVADMVGYFDIDRKTQKHKVSFKENNQTYAKIREPKGWKRPAPRDMDDPDLAVLLGIIHNDPE